jgi:hypothetical protein
MTNKILFINNFENEKIETPRPAKMFLPEWYKNIDSFYSDSNSSGKKPHVDHENTSTIKRCVPVLDSITSGYIISTVFDIFTEPISENSRVYHPKFLGYITTHGHDQFKGYPGLELGADAPKIINYWGIKTPKGYSCLFVSPMHRPNIIDILPGVVDTDKYNNPVHFPFTISDKNFSGMIPAGTPLVQVIPFKRDSWISDFTNDNVKSKQDKFKINQVFFDGYRNSFWSKKQYK